MKKLLLPLLASTLLLVGCAQMFQPKVDMVSGSGNLTDLLAEKAAITSLATPAQLNVSKGDSSFYIDLNWSGVEGAVSYLIQRAEVKPNAEGKYDEPTEELYEDLEKMVYGTAYRDTTATNKDSRYYYRVSAENSREKLEPSAFTPAEYGCLLGTPSNIRADLGIHTDKINIYWDPVEYATSYEIHRGTDSNGAGSVKLATIPSNRTQYTNNVITEDQGKEFYYKVYAVNRTGSLSSASSVQMGFALVEGAPSQPQNVVVSNGRGTTTGNISIKWDAVNSSADEIIYYIYRSSSEDSALLLLDSVKNSTEYTDSRSLKNGVYYYYQVQASVFDEAGVELKSKFSDSGKLTADGKENTKAAEGFILSPPDEVFAEKTAGNAITIRFSPAIGNSTEQGKYIYKIYGDNNQTGDFTTEIKSVNASELTLSDGYYSVTDVDSYNFYRVATVNENVMSRKSSVVAPTPFAAKIKSVSQAANFGFRDADANSSGVYPVKITWDKPSEDNPAGYHVYRSSSKDSGYRKVTSDPVSIDNALEYMDANDTARAGKKYWYKVLSLNSLGQGSHYSEPMQGWGALTHEQYLIEFNKTVVSAQKRLSLMHKPGNTDKLGSESVSGIISGSLSYNAAIDGLGARIIMRYENLADFYIDGDKANGVYFTLTGNSNTSANMSSNGDMDGTVTCTGMYPGSVSYDNIQIKGGVAGGGTYGVTPEGFSKVEVPYNKI